MGRFGATCRGCSPSSWAWARGRKEGRGRGPQKTSPAHDSRPSSARSLGWGGEAGPSVFLFPVTIASSEGSSGDEGDGGKLP